MLYVFWVEKGSIITLLLDVAVDTVLNLKSVLARPQYTGVAEANQVLLINGGESLQDNQRVAKYQSGTDTNPIFLFNRAAIEADHAPELSFDMLTDIPDEVEAKENIQALLTMPSNLNSILSRTQLAQQYHDYAREINRQCSALVQEQHLQHQGWQAVMANLDDVITAFLKRLDKFKTTFRTYLDSRIRDLDKLERIGQSVDILGRIPLFPSLLKGNKAKHEETMAGHNVRDDKVIEEEWSDEVRDSPDMFSSPPDHDEITILDWISAKDADHSLLAVAEGCRRTMETFDESTLDDVENEAAAVVEFCNNPAMKEIKGLAERLFGLDQLMSEAKKYVLDQKETAEIFFKIQNQITGTPNTHLASGSGHISKELAAAYSQPFTQLLRCHSKLWDIKRRCLGAKQELCKHLHSRLKWVVAVENGMMEVDDKMKIYYENIRRIRRLLHMLDQVSTAPQVFIYALLEVRRRRRYAQSFIKWASGVSAVSVDAYSKENVARRDFTKQYGSHFLLSLFPGLEQYPPQFASTVPEPFDTRLPLISAGDLHLLKSRVPELKEYFLSEDTSEESLKDPPNNTALAQPARTSSAATIISENEYKKAEDPQENVLEPNDSSPIPLRWKCDDVIRDRLERAVAMVRTLSDSFHSGGRVLKDDITQIKEDFAVQCSQIERAILDAKQYGLICARMEKEKDVAVDEAWREVVEERVRRIETEKIAERLREDLMKAETFLRVGYKTDRVVQTDEIPTNNQVFSVNSIGELEIALSASCREDQYPSGRTEDEFDALQADLRLLREEKGKHEEERLVWQQTLLQKDEEMEGLRKELEDERRKICLFEEQRSVQQKMQSENASNELLVETMLAGRVISPQLPPESDGDVRVGSGKREATMTNCDGKLCVHGNVVCTPGMEMHLQGIHEDNSVSQQRFGPGRFPAGGVRERDSSVAVGVSISLSSCNMGDLLLFVYNYEFKQYTAYLPFKRSLYLLHSESHEELGLISHLVEGDLHGRQRSWCVAEVLSKEYVLTKKGITRLVYSLINVPPTEGQKWQSNSSAAHCPIVPNRYRLAVGTKFYRIKARAWNIEALLAQHEERLSRLPLSISPSLLTSYSVPSTSTMQGREPLSSPPFVPTSHLTRNMDSFAVLSNTGRISPVPSDRELSPPPNERRFDM